MDNNDVNLSGIDIFGESIKGQKGEKKKVLVTETVLRDAHQSLMATRMRTEDMLSVAAKMDEIGYYSFEMWGGATFDAAMRFLNEDPWERLRALRRVVKKTKLQMLLRGQNIVGYKHYPDDVVREFVKRAVGNGLDIIRVFDALNDLRNMEVAADQVKKEGAHLQLSICYTISPVHTLESFAQLAQEMKAMGADSICIKDMAGLLSPVAAYRLVKAIKEKCDLPVQVHTHYTSGMGSMAYLAAILAGADVVDCAISPFSMGTSQPPTESLVASLKDSIYDTGIELQDLVPIANHFKEVRKKNEDLIVGLTGVDINVLIYQIPGGMYSNLVSQLKEQNALDKLDSVLKEVPKVRREMGYPPLVTPTSQIVGTQATLNVLVGKRWHMVPNEVKMYFLGYYGKPPASVDPEVAKKVIGEEKPITCRPGEILPPGLEEARKAVESWILQPEDVLSYALFPNVAKDFLIRKFARTLKRDVGFEEIVEGVAYPV
ncbi:oxaloacetate decarboxylase, alpha subunit [Acetomicrobium thermoterrenum DSM 13490]|uniref:Oxaloacetate decarboxylase, alpha subunit n=1 Tax=Acetomicrobium thermoterrenum DSM 13490 TaxID=1120987 RepID=A0A1H3DQQ0_9BACT|nr:pyruvate carboxylase subunit B [Acetomicrobium thermoterrenum]SDX68660.1 oxaloacetate decarboxylase, alpha subunit [Acetomicrobium thermoterrenum DSM 13490]